MTDVVNKNFELAHKKPHINFLLHHADFLHCCYTSFVSIGPASQKVEVLEQMIETGMNIARLNFSHGSYEYHGGTITNIRAAAANYSKKVGMEHALAIALDTKGPEIRTGLLEGGGSAEIELIRGEKIKLTTDASLTDKGNKDCIFVDYTNIVKVVKVGSKIFVDDGLISLVVLEIGE
jgi:pyruvate kinase